MRYPLRDVPRVIARMTRPRHGVLAVDPLAAPPPRVARKRSDPSKPEVQNPVARDSVVVLAGWSRDFLS